jgi:hypothetical protein
VLIPQKARIATVSFKAVGLIRMYLSDGM